MNQVWKYSCIFVIILFLVCGINFFYDEKNDDKIALGTECRNCHLVNNIEQENKLNNIKNKINNCQFTANIDNRTLIKFNNKDNEKLYINIANIFSQYYSKYYSDSLRLRQKHTLAIEEELALLLRQIAPHYEIKNYVYQWAHTDNSDYLMFEIKMNDNEIWYIFTKFTDVKSMID